ncbi:hypothetical protein Ddye_012062 [Dipteronia dyeriana]|uniref:Reverse transcriptase zinc-binding domain-containing protein n=1 Tax=Dipteronia dyeriana TaxID=168575 RepID=A0AAD9X3S1_9ROSI|nr:hypothetical protein Ddye_012062 [Dipteronia dyeriana]
MTSSFKVVFPAKLGDDAKVNILISPSGTLDVQLLQQHFLPEDMEAILKIPTGPSGFADTMLWHYKGYERYSVKSGYWLRCKMVEESGTSNATSLTQWWNFLWKMNVPLKIIFFIWRACFDWIPTTANLARQKVSVSGRCPVCNDATDSTLHALWNCKNLKAIRAEWRPILGSNNNVVTGEKQRQRIWIPPSQGQYKTNCSTIIDRRKGWIGFGIIIRNMNGEVMASSAHSIIANFSFKVAQLLAIKKSIQFGLDCGLALCLLEISEFMVVNWLLDGNHKNSDSGMILEEIVDMINTGNRVAVISIFRSANMPAYVLAGEALKILEDVFWMEECPCYLDDLLKADMHV